MDWLRRLLGDDPDAARDDEPVPEASEPVPDEPPLEPADEAPAAADPLPCPTCAVLLDPPPPRNRLCPYCRQLVVVRRVDGRTVLFTEQAVAVFEAQRQRELDEARWAASREQWLLLARSVGAAPDRRARIAAMPISAEVVDAARRLYTTSATKAIADARRERHWGNVGQLAREEAAALYRDAGSPIPVPEEILALHREGMVAVLRSLGPMTKDVEVVSAECCKACRADEGETFKTADEIRTPRLPHDGCPKGLCGCDWWPAVVDRRRKRRRRASSAAAGSVPASGVSEDAAAADHPGLEGGGGDDVAPVEEGEGVPADDPPIGQ